MKRQIRRISLSRSYCIWKQAGSGKVNTRPQAGVVCIRQTLWIHLPSHLTEMISVRSLEAWHAACVLKSPSRHGADQPTRSCPLQNACARNNSLRLNSVGTELRWSIINRKNSDRESSLAHRRLSFLNSSGWFFLLHDKGAYPSDSTFFRIYDWDQCGLIWLIGANQVKIIIYCSVQLAQIFFSKCITNLSNCVIILCCVVLAISKTIELKH